MNPIELYRQAYIAKTAADSDPTPEVRDAAIGGGLMAGAGIGGGLASQKVGSILDAIRDRLKQRARDFTSDEGQYRGSRASDNARHFHIDRSFDPLVNSRKDFDIIRAAAKKKGDKVAASINAKNTAASNKLAKAIARLYRYKGLTDAGKYVLPAAGLAGAIGYATSKMKRDE